MFIIFWKRWIWKSDRPLSSELQQSRLLVIKVWMIITADSLDKHFHTWSQWEKKNIYMLQSKKFLAVEDGYIPSSLTAKDNLLISYLLKEDLSNLIFL